MANIVNQYGQVKVGVRVQSSGGGGIDADAQAFITAASITDSTQQSAINTLVTQLKTYGIWSKLKAVYPFVGGNASAHKFNLKDPRDLDAAYRLTFSGGFTHNSLGVVPNGTNSYANPFFMGTTFTSVNNAHISYYSQTSTETNANSIEIGCFSSVNSEIAINICRPNNSSAAVLFSENNIILATNTDGKGLYTLSRTANNSLKYYKNNTTLGTATGIDAGSTQPSKNVFLFTSGNALNQADGLYTTNKISSFISLGDGLTDTEAANFYTAVQTFQSTLGRQVGVPIVADTDAQAFLNAAVITDSTQASAITTLVTDLKSANIWTKMKAIYPFVGGTATTHKFNLKDPRDVDAAFRLSFNGGWTHNANGATPNGTNGYARTYFVGTNLSPNSSSYSIYNRSVTPTTKNIIDFGYFRLDSSYISNLFTTYYDGGYGGRVNSWNSTGLPQTSPQGFYNGNRTNSLEFNLFKNSSKVVTASDNTAGKLQVNYEFHLGCLFINGLYYSDFSTNNYAFTSIGDGLSDAEAVAFYTAVQKYQTSLGRQV